MNLLSQIQSLINESGERQAKRLKSKVDDVRGDMNTSRVAFQKADMKYGEDMDQWTQKEDDLVEEVTRSKDSLKTKMRNDWMVCPVTPDDAYRLLI
jgi:kinesin family protein 11